MTRPRRIVHSSAFIKVILTAVVAVGAAWSQTVSLSLSGGSGAPGATVTVGVALSSSGGAQPAGVGWDLIFSPGDLSPASGTYYATGGAATAAGKAVTCNLAAPGDIRCIAVGFNTTPIGNGGIGTVTFQISAGTTNTSSIVSLTGVSASDASGTAISATGTGTTITINQPVNTVSVSSLTCSPGSLTPPATSSCTVNLSGAATSTTSVTLTSGSVYASVPPSVTVSAGASSAGFTVSAPSAVSTNGSALLTAILNGVSVNFTLTLNAAGGPAVLSNLICAPASLTPPGTASCTVSLSGTATGATSVSLSSGNPAVTLPPSVTIGSGASSIGFTATAAAAVSVNSSAMLTASLNGNSRNFSLGLTAAQATQPAVSSLVCTPSTVAGGSNTSCTVYLTGSAPSGGTPVSLSSNNPNAIVPAQVTVPAGLSSANFALSTLAVASTQTPVVSAASSSGGTQTATLTLQAGGISLASLKCTPGVIATTSSTNCAVNLTGNAPIGGLTVTLNSDSAMLTVPANVLVPAGSKSVGFTAMAGTPVSDLTVMLTAMMNGAVTTFPVSIVTSPNVASVSCSPSNLPQGSSSTCSVTLNKTASGTGVGVTLTSSSPKIAVPGSVTVPTGGIKANFTAIAASDAGNISDTITATTTTVSQTAVLNVYQPLNAILVCTPTSIQTPGTGTCTLTLNNPAQASTSISLVSSSASLTMPTVVTIGTGMSSATFTISAASVASSTTASVSAAGNVSQSVTLLAAQNSAATVSCGPQTLTGSGQTACTLTLTAPAPTGGLSIALSSSSTQLTVPTAVQIPQGNTSAAFNANASIINQDETATITATIQNSPVQTAVSLVSFKPLAIACTPQSVNAGSPLTCQVTMSAAATSSGVAIHIGTSNSHVSPPSSVPVPPGQSAVTFQATTSGLTQKQTGVITATFGSYSVLATITIGVAPPALIVPGPLSTLPGKTTTFTVAASDPAGMAVTLSVLQLPQTATFDAPSGVFTWVPSASQIGGHTVQFTATNTAGASSSKNVFVNVGSDTPVILSLANAASYVNDGGCSPGAVATFLGEGFAKTAPKAASTSPIPTEVNGVRVKANGDYIPVFYASETQINLQCPELAPGTPLTLTVESATGTSSPLPTTVQYATPGIFSLDGSGRGQGAILLANSPDVAMPHTDGIPSQPAKPGNTISIYATGLGPVDTNLPVGQPAPNNVLVRATAPIDVLIDGLNADISFAGLAPGYTGLFQVNAKVPASIHTSNAVSVQIMTHRPDGSIAQSNVVTIAVAAAN